MAETGLSAQALAPAPAPATRSLTRRLALLLAIFLLATGSLIAALSFSYGKAAAEKTFDRLLLGAASQIAASVSVQDGRIVTDLPVSAFELLALAPDDRIFYAVRGPDGALITGDDLALPEGRGVRFFAGADTGEATRYVVMERIFAEQGFSGVVSVIVGHTDRARAELAVEITRNALVLSALAGALLVVLAVLVARAALGPLRVIETAIEARSPQDVSPLDLPVPREITRLVAALNGFMSRLERNLAINRRLLADASHQIRTPIAALRAQAELAVDEEDPARLKRLARRIHARAVDLTGLTERMLSRAMVIHRVDAAPQLRVDLRDVGMDAAEEIGDAMPARRKDLRLDLPDAPVEVLADDLSLREAAKNLVMNALQHGQPPVRIIARHEGDRAVLAVQDSGPGPAEHAPEPAAGTPSPARRAGGRAPSKGTGLGISIVRAVLQAHGGDLRCQRLPDRYEAAMLLPRHPDDTGAPS